MDLASYDNTSTAADPQAIRSRPPLKQPVFDNDPTRDISSAERIRRKLLESLAVVALAVMLLATILMFVDR